MFTEIVRAIESQGGRCFLVGGSVRDEIMGKAPNDFDVEVFGIKVSTLVSVLARFGKVDAVGATFGIIKLFSGGEEYDFSLPRRENKEGQGHKGFIVEVDPEMTVTDAARRRDFTINAISKDSAGNIYDPYDGRTDIKLGILRHVSDAFGEDPLRVLRGMQLAGRFDLTTTNKTAKLCSSLRAEYPSLPKSRVWGEWQKWAAKSVKPSRGLRFLYKTGWVYLYPELAALIGLQQEPDWHPEGSVHIHTAFVCDEAARIADRDNLSEIERVTLVMGALCHDLGKATTTKIIDGKITSHEHDVAGKAPTRSFLTSIGAPVKLTNAVAELTVYHMYHTSGIPTPRMAQRFAAKLQYNTPNQLFRLMEADSSGRPPKAKGMPTNAFFLKSLVDQIGPVFVPILQGRDLIAQGWPGDAEMGRVLRVIKECQIEGIITTLQEALTYANSIRQANNL